MLAQEKKATVEALKDKAVENAQQHKRAKRDSAKWLRENKTALLLAVALVIVAGYATIVLSPDPNTVNLGNFHGNENGTGNGTGIVTQDAFPKMFLIYSRDCEACHAGNSFELLLRKNEIDFVAEEVEASTFEGQQFIEELNLKKLPVLIIDATSLSDSLVVQADESLKIASGSIGLKSLMNVLSINFPNNISFHPTADIYIISLGQISEELFSEYFPVLLILISAVFTAAIWFTVLMDYRKERQKESRR